MQGETFTDSDLKDLDKLSDMLTKLSPKNCKDLKQKLTKKRIANTPERQDGEDTVLYLLRRAHRDMSEDVLDLPKYEQKEKNGRSKAKTKKAKTTLKDSG